MESKFNTYVVIKWIIGENQEKKETENSLDGWKNLWKLNFEMFIFIIIQK